MSIDVKDGFESFKDSKMFWDLAANEQLTQAAKKSPTKIAKLKN